MDTSDKKEEIPEEEGPFVDEETSFSFLFFLIAGAALVVALWAWWNDEYSRRGYKAFQEEFHQTEFSRAEDEWKTVTTNISSKEKELETSLVQVDSQLNSSEEYQKLADSVSEAEVILADVKEEKKFAGSRLDEAYYYYKKAMHAGENFDVQLGKLREIERQLAEFIPEIAEKQKLFDGAQSKLLEFKAKKVNLEKELRELTMNKEQLEKRMDFYKPLPFFIRPAEIQQTVIPGYGVNNFSEIIYKVDRCMTCHIAYKDSFYKDHPQPLKSHPNPAILIDKHPPEKTGCTWCHYGQGTATAPADHAHGSHHETDQTVGINEPILTGGFMQSTCRNCHAEVVDLEGAPLLSKGKRLFMELGCHGCHLADGYSQERKVGPRLTRVKYKVDPSWLTRWVKNPKEYLPKTKMPEFGLDEKDTLAISAYIMASSDKDYVLPEKFESGDPENGQELFESVGCLACHELGDKGEVFGPSLNNIGEKVNADWLVSWLSAPKKYNDHSIMPDLRLTKEQASNITSYLMQFGKKKVVAGLQEKLADPSLIKEGEVLVRRRGCFACHDINGMENEGRIAPELSSFGRKLIVELEFGDSHVPHTWESWVRTKLRKPDSFRTERVLDKMPNFHLKDDEIDALVVLLRGFNGTNIPEKYRKNLSKREMTLETGRRLITKYNCKGCHHVEGDGGRIQKYIPSTALYPPPLELDTYHVGQRIKGSWLFSFLKNPTPVRTWVKTKMPTFFLKDEEVRDLTAYFEALSAEEIPYEAGVHVKKDKTSIDNGVKIVNYMDCGKCHDEGAKGIDFSIASNRLRQDWIPKWLKNTREMIPWTKMPNHWDREGETMVVKPKYSELNSIGSVDKQLESIRDFIVSYNTASFDSSLAMGDSASADEGAAEEEEAASEDEDEEDD